MSIKNIDIVILSYAFSDHLKNVTVNCIRSLIESEDPSMIQFNILVIESQKNLNNYQYEFSKTIYPYEPFGYNHYMNIGVRMTNSEYICLCNNDLLFYEGWATEMLKYADEFDDLYSLSPAWPSMHQSIGIQLNSGVKFGYRIGVELTGWCLFLKRKIFDFIGELDENYTFSGADHDYAYTLAALGLKHALVTSSWVDHLENITLMSQDSNKQKALKAVPYHYRKWSHRVLNIDAKH